MSQDKLTLEEVLYKNRLLVLAILSVPLFGMVIAIILILYTKPDNMVVVLGVILFLMMQYIIMMFFWLKKVESLAKRRAVGDEKVVEDTSIDVIEVDADPVLLPEEERVLSSEKNK